MVAAKKAAAKKFNCKLCEKDFSYCIKHMDTTLNDSLDGAMPTLLHCMSLWDWAGHIADWQEYFLDRYETRLLEAIQCVDQNELFEAFKDQITKGDYAILSGSPIQLTATKNGCGIGSLSIQSLLP